jgi:hypothetical protein
MYLPPRPLHLAILSPGLCHDDAESLLYFNTRLAVAAPFRYTASFSAESSNEVPAMPQPTAARKSTSMSDAAVQKATGKNWSQWFAILDKAGARTMPHPEIARMIGSNYKCPSWWRQMVTVEYERARGLRAKYETTSGFHAGRSITLGVPIGKVFDAWQDSSARRRWLPDPHFTVRKATVNKSMRITWGDGTTNVEAMFYSKGPKKSLLTVDVTRLSNAKGVAQWKSYWGDALAKLKSLLEA